MTSMAPASLRRPARRTDPDDQPGRPSSEDRRPRPRGRPRRCSSCATGCPPIIETDAGLAEVCAALAAGTGPVAIDAERASGYRYSNRAYLIQLRREGAGTWLVDPIGLTTLAPLQDGARGHRVDPARRHPGPALPRARSACVPTSLFDTELAGRLLGYPRVGLATLVETVLGQPAAQGALGGRLVDAPAARGLAGVRRPRRRGARRAARRTGRRAREAGKAEWARQEFEHLLGFEPAAAGRRVAPYVRRCTGCAGAAPSARSARCGRPATRSPPSATSRPGRILPDSAIVVAATAMPTDRRALLAHPGFHGRGASRYSARWVDALQRVREMPEDELPARAPRGDGPPHPRAWADRDPVADRRFRPPARRCSSWPRSTTCRSRTCSPPTTCAACCGRRRRPASRPRCADDVAPSCASYGAGAWQAELVTGALRRRAILGADVEPVARRRRCRRLEPGEPADPTGTTPTATPVGLLGRRLASPRAGGSSARPGRSRSVIASRSSAPAR